MNTLRLKRFAQFARRSLVEQVSTKMKLVLEEDSVARNESIEVINKLEDAIKNHGEEQVIERVAYIWFNRFCALRFMDVKCYNPIKIVSPANPGRFLPEILDEAMLGHIDEGMVSDEVRQKIFTLLDGETPSPDHLGEAYRLLVLASCNYWHRAMPFLFQDIDDYTELLIPDDLMSGNSILAYTREAMTPDMCKDVEIFGWLYQFYISEKKDEVFRGLRKTKKIAPENIPTTTQLFTLHWVVKYLVENSLGRLWMFNRPNSPLAEQMEYYTPPTGSGLWDVVDKEGEKPQGTVRLAEVDGFGLRNSQGTSSDITDYLRVSSPEGIRICDPACGSGHMLAYAFDLLYAIYEEEGYDTAEIPTLILTHNLYGIEIDERAGGLAALVLTMKARSKQQDFFHKQTQPNICVLESIHFDESELGEYMDFIGKDLFNTSLQTTLYQFDETNTFGSLLHPFLTDVSDVLKTLETKDLTGQLFLGETHNKVLQALRQVEYLSPKYHIVTTNPPHMNSRLMNKRLNKWAKNNYPSSKTDLFAMFIERNLNLVQQQGTVAMFTVQDWLFSASFKKLRSNLLTRGTVLSMADLEVKVFDEDERKVITATAFVLENQHKPEYRGGCLQLFGDGSDIDIRETIENSLLLERIKSGKLN